MAQHDSSVVTCSLALWWKLFRELRRRGAGVRESGAFLLGVRQGDTAKVKSLVFYDDVDPGALSTGIVRLSGHSMHEVWQICADKGQIVLADIHTHPAGARQSRSDQDHPMVAMRGHLALIAPRFADSAFDFAGIGVYDYRGAKRWDILPPPRFGWFCVQIRGA